jgi:very-short-patch-repair endonuclease
MDLRPVVAVAERQRGVIVSTQLRTGGISPKVERRLAEDGYLRLIRPGAYAVAGAPQSRWESAIAAALLCGPAAVISHSTAAAIHRLPDLWPEPLPEISVPVQVNPRLPGVRIHRVADLPLADIVERRGVGLTTPSRTLVDLASRLDSELLARVVDEGSIARLWTVDELLECANRLASPGRPGGRALRAVLAGRVDDPAADSLLELRVIRLLKPFEPFQTQFQVVLDGEVFVLDIAWPWWRVALEVDGWWSRRQSRRKLDDDDHKTNALTGNGWRLLRVTATMRDATILRDVGRLLPAGLASIRAR